MITTRRASVPTLLTHGGLQDNLNATQNLDFSVNANPFPPPDSVLRSVRNVPVSCYPNIRPQMLVQRIAKQTGLSITEILGCNGSSEALLLLAIAYLQKGDTVMQFTPCYGEYAHVSEIMGAEVHSVHNDVESSAALDIQAVDTVLKQSGARICWLCNPSSPAGASLNITEITALATLCKEHSCILVIDEAYANFLEERPKTLPLIADGFLVLLRSMTKDYNLNALRLGYIAAHAQIIATLSSIQPPWSVNLPAEQAGIAALDAEPYYQETWQKTRMLRAGLERSIAELGYRVLPGNANYFLVYDHSEKGDLADRLQQHGMYVRDCRSFELERYIRIGTSTEQNNKKLITVLEQW